MDDENTAKALNLVDDKPLFDVESARKVMETTDTVTGTLRQIVEGTMLGVSIAIFAALLGVSRLDDALNVATVALAIAVPPLAISLMIASYRRKPQVRENILDFIGVGAWLLGGIGQVAFAVGVSAIIAHLSRIAFIAYLVAIPLGFLLLLVLSFGYGWLHVSRQIKIEAKAQ